MMESYKKRIDAVVNGLKLPVVELAEPIEMKFGDICYRVHYKQDRGCSGYYADFNSLDNAKVKIRTLKEKGYTDVKIVKITELLEVIEEG